MTCPTEHCKEMEATQKDIDTLYTKVDEVKICAGKKVDKDSIKWHIRTYIVALLVIAASAVTMWADTRELTKDVPALSADLKETTKIVTEHDKEIEKIKLQMENINNNTTTMLEILERQERERRRIE